MALHTYFGPLRNYQADVAQWGDGRTTAPPLRWQIAQFMTRFGSAPPLPWQPREFTGEQHLAAGAFLLRNKLHFAAESELHKALVAPAKHNPYILEANALFALARSVADRGGDDETSAGFLERGMHIKRTRQWFSVTFSSGIFDGLQCEQGLPGRPVKTAAFRAQHSR